MPDEARPSDSHESSKPMPHAHTSNNKLPPQFLAFRTRFRPTKVLYAHKISRRKEKGGTRTPALYYKEIGCAATPAQLRE